MSKQLVCMGIQIN